MGFEKFIPAITIVGMITICSSVSSFATSNYTDNSSTIMWGEYANKLPNETISSFILDSKGDYVSSKDLFGSYCTKNITYDSSESKLDSNAKFATGDKIKVDGLSKTVLIYGDVTRDGKVSISDATKIIGSITDETPLPKLEFIAADLNSDGKVKISDVTPLISYIIEDENTTYIYDQLTSNYDYTLEPTVEYSDFDASKNGFWNGEGLDLKIENSKAYITLTDKKLINDTIYNGIGNSKNFNLPENKQVEISGLSSVGVKQILLSIDTYDYLYSTIYFLMNDNTVEWINLEDALLYKESSIKSNGIINDFGTYINIANLKTVLIKSTSGDSSVQFFNTDVAVTEDGEMIDIWPNDE